jgi:hypothetical protein
MYKVENGWTFSRERFSIAALKVFDIAIDDRRMRLLLGPKTLRDMRFNDNAAILARIESMYTEKEFMVCPGLRIDNALVDAAQADWWYQYEKEYDESETEIVDDE